MPKLTVMIPVYNVEGYLAKCLDSVIYPELGDYEIVLVNDGSTDRSGEICAEYAARYPQLIRVITTENGGLGKARDVGIDNAAGEFILFLDSDDYLSENALPEMMELLKGDFDMCFFDIRSVNESGRLLKYMHGCSIEGEFTLDSFPELLFEMPSAWNKNIPTRAFHRKRHILPRARMVRGYVRHAAPLYKGEKNALGTQALAQLSPARGVDNQQRQHEAQFGDNTGGERHARRVQKRGRL